MVCGECQLCEDGVCVEDPSCCENPQYNYGCGEYIITFTETITRGNERSCQTDVISTPAYSQTTTKSYAMNGCDGYFVLNDRIVYAKDCGPLDATGISSISQVKGFAAGSPGGTPVEQFDITQSGGQLFNPYEYWDEDQVTIASGASVTFNGNPVEPNGCGG